MVEENDCCKMFYVYLSSELVDNILLNDFTNGSKYKNICQKYGVENILDYIFIAFSTYVSHLCKTNNYEMCEIIAIFLNFPPNVRYSVSEFLPLMYIPGPPCPSELHSFFVSLIREVRSSNEHRFNLKFYDGSIREVRIHVLWVQGDTPAISKIVGLVGHRSKCPCHSCSITGTILNFGGRDTTIHRA